MTPAQCRAARALVGLSQEGLAVASKVAKRTIASFEGGQHQTAERTLEALQRALEKEGVIFIDSNGEGAGVRLRKAAT